MTIPEAQDIFFTEIKKLLDIHISYVYIPYSKIKKEIDYETYDKIQALCLDMEQRMLEYNITSTTKKYNTRWSFMWIESSFTFSFRKAKINSFGIF